MGHGWVVDCETPRIGQSMQCDSTVWSSAKKVVEKVVRQRLTARKRLPKDGVAKRENDQQTEVETWLAEKKFTGEYGSTKHARFRVSSL